MAHKYFFIINFRFVANLLKKGSNTLVEEEEKLKVNDRDTQWVSTFFTRQSESNSLEFLLLTLTVIGRT